MAGRIHKRVTLCEGQSSAPVRTTRTTRLVCCLVLTRRVPVPVYSKCTATYNSIYVYLCPSSPFACQAAQQLLSVTKPYCLITLVHTPCTPCLQLPHEGVIALTRDSPSDFLLSHHDTRRSSNSGTHDGNTIPPSSSSTAPAAASASSTGYHHADANRRASGTGAGLGGIPHGASGQQPGHGGAVQDAALVSELQGLPHESFLHVLSVVHQ